MARQEDITIDQGSDIAIELYVDSADGSNKDLSGYTPLAKMIILHQRLLMLQLV